MARHATSTTAELVGRLHANADQVESLIAGLRRIHPERMTAQDWRELRLDTLATYQLLADQLRLIADLLHERRVGHERDYP